MASESIASKRELLDRGLAQVELSRLLHEAAGGRGRLVFLGGEAGIGKTALVTRFSQLVRDSSKLLAGACDPLSTPRPLGPLLDMRERVGPRLRDLIENKGACESLFRAFLSEITGERGATLVVIEDVHWADEATLDLLRFLARRLQDAPALLIATYRDDEAGDGHPLRLVLGDVATLPAVHRMRLEPLSLAAVRRLSAGTTLDPVALHRQTGGNPFYVTEVIDSGGEGIPATVRDAVLARAARLSAPAREALNAAAVLGFRFESSLPEVVASVDGSAVDECLASGMLQSSGDRLNFRHELVREAVLDALSPRRRMALHRAALDALRPLADSASELGRLAHHAEGAGDAAAVLEYAPRAARGAAAMNANREAVAQYERALRYGDRLQPRERAALLMEYSHVCGATDRYDRSIEADYQIIEIWRREGEVAKEGWAHAFLAGCLVSVGRNAEAEAASRTSIELLERLPPGPELAEAYVVQAGLRMLNRDSQEAIAWAERALEIAEPSGYADTRIKAYNRRGSARIVSGDGEGEYDLLQSLALAREAGIPWNVALAYVNLGSAWGELYRLEKAERWLTEGIAFTVEHELEAHRRYMLSWLALVRLFKGDWTGAEEAATEVVAPRGSSAIARITALVALGRLLARQGDPRAEERLDEALELALPTGTLQRLAPVRAARAEAAWLAGDLRRCREEAGAALDLAVHHRHPWFAGELLSWMRRTGEPIDLPDWIAAPFARQIAGDWRAAAEEWNGLGCVYEAAQALAQSCETEDLLGALAEFERLGARPAVQRVQERLRERGVRGIPRGPRPSTLANPAGLTRREAEIAELLAAGLRNGEIAKRLYLSPKTVGHHVSAVLAKLGVTSRNHVARATSQLPEPQDREAMTPT